jgi:predicted 2-oxoglutarate/Fe(II)-dependent dioxygenase YbiX
VNKDFFEPAPGVAIYPKLLPEALELLEVLKNNYSVDNNLPLANWEDWYPGDNKGSIIYGKECKINPKHLVDINSPEYLKVQNVIDTLNEAFVVATEDYMERNGISKEKTYPVEPSFHRYYEGGIMPSHVDQMGENQNPRPLLTTTIYLNDDYVGGDLVFDSFGVEYKPTAGSVVIFPSGEPYYHTSKLITSGDKYFGRYFWMIED